jgi:hypothetical protein
VVSGWGLHAVDHQAAANPGNLYYGVTTQFAAKRVTDIMEWLIKLALPVRDRPGEGLQPVLGRTHHTWKSPHVANATGTWEQTRSVMAGSA